MLENIKKIDSKFTLKRKGFFALGAVIFAAVWAVLWLVFPMLWYSLFFASTVGCYVTLALLGTVLITIMCWLCSLATSLDISVTKNFIVNLIFLVGIFFLFAAFRYSMVYLVIIAAVLHCAANVWVLGTARIRHREKVKRMKSKPVFYEKITGGKVDVDEKSAEDVIAVKSHPVVMILISLLYTLVINAAYIFLAWEIAFTFSE
jgi:hypothetical protein